VVNVWQAVFTFNRLLQVSAKIPYIVNDLQICVKDDEMCKYLEMTVILYL